MKRLVAAISVSIAFAMANAAQGAQFCTAEVLHSEMLPVGSAFYHTVKATLLVTPADRPSFETTVVRAIPWQASPPRQGQRQRLPCEAALLPSLVRWF